MRLRRRLGGPLAVQARTTAAFHRTLRPLAASAPRKPSRLLPTRKRAVTGASDPSCHTSGAHRALGGRTDGGRGGRPPSSVATTRPSARWEESHAATSRLYVGD